MRIATLLTLIVVALIQPIRAQTFVSGHITTNSTWYPSGNPYIVTYDIFIDENAQLTIKPGVIVKFEQNKGIQVSGILEAIGTADSIITLNSNAFVIGNGYWAGIFFDDSSADFDFINHQGCILQYCLFDYAKGTFDSISTVDFAVRSYHANPFIDHCTFRNIRSGIGADNADDIKITNCVVLSADSWDGAISIYGNANEIAYNLFYGCKTDVVHITPGLTSGEPNNFHNNIIAGNYFQMGGFFNSIIANTAWWENTIVDNVTDNLQSFILLTDSCQFTYNTVLRNALDPGGGTPRWMPVSAWYTTHFNHNNILRNDTIYNYWNYNAQFYSFTAEMNDQSFLPHVDVLNNYWGTNDPLLVDSMIYDYNENNTLCIADYTPFLSSPDTTAPVIPPSEVHKTDLGAGSVLVSWESNLESDLAGYKVYWGNFTGYSFANSIDAGNVTSYVLTGASINDTIGVTAYDTHADGLDDQVGGNESWFTYAISGLQIGINEPLSQIDLRIFPNPFDDAFTILFNDELHEPLNIEIWNAVGERMICIPSMQNRSITITTTSLPAGIYEYRITSASGKFSIGKLICQ